MSAQELPFWIHLDDGIQAASLSFYEALSYSQTYEVIGGAAQFRTLDGTGVKQQNWAKLKTTVSGEGGLPVGLSGLDYSDTLILKCGAPRAISSTNNVIVIPANRRTDTPYLPTARKRIDGYLVPAVVNMIGNTATVVLDAAADTYSVMYYPQIEVLMNDPNESYSIGSSSSGWSFTAEER